MTPSNVVPFPGRNGKWRPNWRNVDEYPDHGQDWYAWMWELLRRNDEYRSDYDRWD